MRIFRIFSIGDIEATAEIKSNNLKVYVHLLCDCGYLEVLGRKRASDYLPYTQRTKFGIINDSGPRNPQQIYDNVSKRKGLRDPNTGKDIYPEKNNEAGRSAWATG